MSIFTKHAMLDTHSMVISLSNTLKLQKYIDISCIDSLKYQKLIGKVSYIS